MQAEPRPGAKIRGIYYGWFLVIIVFIVYIMNAGLTLYGTNTLNAIIVLEEGVGSTSLSTANTLHTAMMGAAGPLVGVLIKKLGHKYMFAAGGLCALLGGLIYALLPAAGWVLVVGHGVFIALAIGFGSSLTAQSLMVQWFDKRQALAMSLALSAGAVGPLAVGLGYAATGSYGGAFLVLGIVNLVMAGACVFLTIPQKRYIPAMSAGPIQK